MGNKGEETKPCQGGLGMGPQRRNYITSPSAGRSAGGVGAAMANRPSEGADGPPRAARGSGRCGSVASILTLRLLPSPPPVRPSVRSAEPPSERFLPRRAAAAAAVSLSMKGS